jgi:hypothetical protein
MRRLGAATAALFVLLAASAAHAEGVNNLMAGINGLATFPADPVMSAWQPPDSLGELPGAPATAHVAGVGHGALMMAYRATMGVMDVLLFPFWVFPTLSPEAHFNVFGDTYEIEYY